MGTAMLLFFATLLFVVFIFIRILALFFKQWRNHNAAASSEFATVQSKTSSDFKFKDSTMTRYSVVFRTMIGTSREIAVTAKTFFSVNEGDSGTLTTKGDYFLSFQRE